MVTDAQKRAAAKYDKSHTKGVYIKLNKTTDADILNRLQEVGNVQGYIKELIRKDIEYIVNRTIKGKKCRIFVEEEK